MCGGTRSLNVRRISKAGLSPRVRGNPYLDRSQPPNRRSIPACAGEPLQCRPPGRCGRVYPRVCGGTLPPRPWTPDCCGLSPRVRGNRRPGCEQADPEGSIPACAGEPGPVRNASSPVKVYPRVCGGTWTLSPIVRGRGGLSPRVRGNRRSGQWRGQSRRSIPACAGEPRGHCGTPAGPAVYPRVCGGTDDGRPVYQTLDGLSPRVRGNLIRRGAALSAPGSIPACAGEPRARAGSRQCRPGSIPACAGEPTAGSSAAKRQKVYPRVCGGTAAAQRAGYIACGLSPRVRGNLVAEDEGNGKARSIPACAGEP